MHEKDKVLLIMIYPSINKFAILIYFQNSQHFHWFVFYHNRFISTEIDIKCRGFDNTSFYSTFLSKYFK